MCSNWTLVLTTDKLLLHQLAMSLSREPNTVQFHIDINVNAFTIYTKTGSMLKVPNSVPSSNLQ